MATDSGPSGKSATVTTSDTATQPVGRGLFVGTSGTITGQLIDDTTDRVFKNVVAGVEHGLRFSYIRATGTTAADMIVLF